MKASACRCRQNIWRQAPVYFEQNIGEMKSVSSPDRTDDCPQWMELLPWVLSWNWNRITSAYGLLIQFSLSEFCVGNWESGNIFLINILFGLWELLEHAGTFFLLDLCNIIYTFAGIEPVEACSSVISEVAQVEMNSTNVASFGRLLAHHSKDIYCTSPLIYLLSLLSLWLVKEKDFFMMTFVIKVKHTVDKVNIKALCHRLVNIETFTVYIIVWMLQFKSVYINSSLTSKDLHNCHNKIDPETEKRWRNGFKLEEICLHRVKQRCGFINKVYLSHKNRKVSLTTIF